jgi:hypothetical protein
MARSRRRRQVVLCKEARRDVSGNGPMVVSIFKKRSERATVDEKKSGYGYEKNGFQSKTS